MKILVKVFANLREGREKEQIMELPEGSTPEAVANSLAIPFEDVAIIMVNGRRVEGDTKLLENDTLALFPPVGGG